MLKTYEFLKRPSPFQREVELSRERHESDLKEKNRLSRMLEFKVRVFKCQVVSLHSSYTCFPAAHNQIFLCAGNIPRGSDKP